MIYNETRWVVVSTIIFSLVTGLTGCRDELPPPVEGPPSIPLSLTVNDSVLRADLVLTQAIKLPSGARALRHELMLDTLKRRAQRLDPSQSPSDVHTWRERLPPEDKEEAALFAWAGHIIKLKSMDTESLQRRYQLEFPAGKRLLGRQISLTPAVTWTEDYYQRHLASFRSWARLKLSQLRHQVIEGAPFSRLAQAESHHEKTRAQGGRITLEMLDEEKFPSRIIRAAKELRPGELSPVLQDDRGAYLIYNSATHRRFALEGEGVFIPKEKLSAQAINHPSLWILLEALCDQSNRCQLDELVPNIPMWREAWTRSPAGQRTLKERKRKKRKRRRLSEKSKGDTRSLSGREYSWSSISEELFTRVGALYRAELSDLTLTQLKDAGGTALLETGPLYQALPMMITSSGVWIVRLTGRTIIPAISTSQLQLISLDLTREGIARKWGTWGVEQVGTQLKDAAEHGRLEEALSTLNMKGEPIDPKTLPPSLLKQVLEVSLTTGTQVICSQGIPEAQAESQSAWYLIELTGRDTVTFEEARSELISKLKRESHDQDAIRRALKQVWSELDVTMMLHDQKLSFTAADSVGFTRKIELQDD